ncbi:abhydrolase domain-containing protein [Elsinoe ampelina]|uniref:Abhydrolase domain-containing protein n=1 Tax=Elsinoe ampelina TaxID=302913 RepID=A0A6A6FXQ3_9PEZI|nr:abhydrolase domain-containing protein [Elsinoe ampelina]
MPLHRARPALRTLATPRGHLTRPFPRHYSTTSEPLTLHHDLYPPPTTTSSPPGNPIIFLHGLFGFSKNNRTISKILARDLSRPVYALDLRNHGLSPHSPTHTYTTMATDVEAFLHTHSLASPTLIGHSMGAKVAMALALRGKCPVANLISVDNAPVDAALKSDFGTYCAGMRAVAAAGVKTLGEADAVMAEYEPEVAVRQFLLMNLVRDKETGRQRWRVPVDILGRSLGHMADFPFKDAGQEGERWEGPALFVRGTRSRYVADETLPVIGNFFPRFEVRDIEAGHWVVSEQPEEFRRVVVEWLQDKK